MDDPLYIFEVLKYIKEIMFFISEVIEKCLEKAEFIAKPSLNDYIDVDFATRAMAKELIAKES